MGVMKVPKTASIGGRRIKIVVEPFKGADSDTFGEYFHDDKLIQLNAGMTDSVTLLTLKHEVLEAALLISGVGFMDAYCQEAVVRCVEEIFDPAWAALFKRIDFDA